MDFIPQDLQLPLVIVVSLGLLYQFVQRYNCYVYKSWISRRQPFSFLATLTFPLTAAPHTPLRRLDC
jgi:hypothetical protein